MVLLALIAGPASSQADLDALGRDAIERLGEAVSDRRPEEIQESLRAIDSAWDGLSSKSRTKVLKAVARLFERYAPRDELREDGTPDRTDVQHCYRMAAGLVFDKDGGDAVLRGALKRSHVREWPEAQAVLIEGLGHRRDPAQLDVLVDHLEHDDVRVLVAATEGLGRLAAADHSVRAAAAGSLIETWTRLASRAERAARRDAEAPEVAVLRRAEFPLADALAALTRRRFDDPADWEAWWRDHGREDDW